MIDGFSVNTNTICARAARARAFGYACVRVTAFWLRVGEPALRCIARLRKQYRCELSKVVYFDNSENMLRGSEIVRILDA